MPEVRISTMDQDEDFAAWLTELLEREAEEAGLPTGFDDRYIGLTDAIGDWIGGLRYYVRGGVAHLLDFVVAEAYGSRVTRTGCSPHSKSARRTRERTSPSSGRMTAAPRGLPRRPSADGRGAPYALHE
jgi:hypothetical protein